MRSNGVLTILIFRTDATPDLQVFTGVAAILRGRSMRKQTAAAFVIGCVLAAVTAQASDTVGQAGPTRLSPEARAARVQTVQDELARLEQRLERTRASLAAGQDALRQVEPVLNRELATVRDGVRALARRMVGLHWREAEPLIRRAEDLDRACTEAGDRVRARLQAEVSAPSSLPATSAEAPTGTGAISGTVTDAATGLPLPTTVYIDVISYDYRPWVRATAVVDGSGHYLVTGLPPGSYRVTASPQSGYVAELWDDILWQGAFDTMLFGDEVMVADGATTEGIDFALDALGKAAGAVTEQSTGNPLADVPVAVYDQSGSGGGSTHTDASGRWLVDGLPPGVYTAIARPDEPFLYQVLGGAGCIAGLCDPADGTTFAVYGGDTADGNDFALDRGGRIRGIVHDAASGAPLEMAEVHFFNATGQSVAYEFTDDSGRYESRSLIPGTYFVESWNSGAPYVDELYENILCFEACDPTSGTPVQVDLGAEVSGIDFDLERKAGLSGTVTEISGLPLTDVQVRVYDDGGFLVRSGWGISSSGYVWSGLIPGTYFITAGSTSLIDELWDDIPCELGCDPTTGTPVQVVQGEITPGVDFVLERSSWIGGSVRDAATDVPIENVPVEVYAADGTLVSSAQTTSAGGYLVYDVPPGDFFVRTRRGSYSQMSRNYPGMLYDGHLCQPECDVTAGDPVAVPATTVVSGIDFRPTPFGTISGTVTATTDGLPLAGLFVQAYEPGGSSAGWGETDASGGYSIGGLLTGPYHVIAWGWDHHLSEVWDAVPCDPEWDCDPSTGDPVDVTQGADTGGIDFALDLLPSISGTVTDLAGAPAPGVSVTVRTDSGSFAGSAVTAADGTYQVGDLLPWTYYVVARGTAYLDELYDDLPCEQGCVYSDGQPIVLDGTQGQSGIDFALEKLGTISGRVTDAVSGAGVGSTKVEVVTAAGEVVRTATTALDGTYSAKGLDTGSYLVRTTGSRLHQDELYPDVPCDSGCDLGLGTPVDVVRGQITEGIDLALAPYQPITGRVTRADTGAPVNHAQVELHRPDGGFVQWLSTASDGTFVTDGLAPGEYLVIAWSSSDLYTVLYDGVVCVVECAPEDGTPVPVTLAGPTSHIDFALPPRVLGFLAVRVVDRSTGLPLEDYPVTTITAEGSDWIRTTDSAGLCQWTDLTPGDVHAFTAGDGDYVDLLWQGIECEPSCDPSLGTPITIAPQATARIELSLRKPYFTDVWVDHWARRYIESLYAAQVTAGCGVDPLRYCPANPVAREQMAVFLLKADEGGGYAPPAATGMFSDVDPGSPFAPWVEELARRGITAGCGVGMFCPSAPVSREQMAVFLLKTLEGSGFIPPDPTGVFEDVDLGSPFAPWIEELVRRAITAGCQADPPLYCPSTEVGRDQMGVFLTKTFSLPPAQ